MIKSWKITIQLLCWVDFPDFLFLQLNFCSSFLSSLFLLTSVLLKFNYTDWFFVSVMAQSIKLRYSNECKKSINLLYIYDNVYLAKKQRR